MLNTPMHRTLLHAVHKVTWRWPNMGSQASLLAKSSLLIGQVTQMDTHN